MMMMMMMMMVGSFRIQSGLRLQTMETRGGRVQRHGFVARLAITSLSRLLLAHRLFRFGLESHRWRCR